MIIYLWVALGSALGGAARYGFALMAGRLWGEAFPWGTIAINVLGSFIIGFFAALTMPEGVLPANPSLRSFVMVGLCGGFTTFSSFSLQTLSLAREGSWIGAMGNVLLSVALCLLAVTLGHYTADRIGHPRTQASSMPRSIVAILDRPETARPVLAAATLAAAMLADDRPGTKPIEVLHLRHDGLDGFMPTEQVMTDQREQEIDGAAARKSAAMHAIFEAWHARSGIGTWREAVGDIGSVVSDATTGADIVVVGHASGVRQDDANQAVHAVLFEARRPVLLVQETIPTALGRSVALAWKQSDAADPAIDATLPMLLRAERVSLLIPAAPDDQPAAPAALLARLEHAGVVVTVNRFRSGGRTIGAALIAEAHAAGADLLVIGGCTHSEIGDFILGGATREIFAAADLPVLLHPHASA